MALTSAGEGASGHGGTICALLVTRDRRAAALQCLRALQRSRGLPGLGLSAVLLDDGSSDGTADAVLAEFPWVQVIRADGSLGGCRAMHHAFAQALRESHSHYLWLGDDTVVQPDALAVLVATARERRGALGHPVIVAGASSDAADGRPSHGGRRRAGRRWRMAWQLLPPTDRPQRIDVMDGHLVLIPAETAELVGNVDAAFEPGLAACDYALRAQLLGVQVWLAPGVLAHAAADPHEGPPRGPAPGGRAPRLARRLPWREWLRFTRRHAGPWWPLSFVCGVAARRTGQR